MKATRKLIPAIAMLLVAAVVMSTASYAWFTMSREVTATGMNVTVTAPSNLVISNAYNGKYSSVADLEVADNTYYVVPSSSVDGKKFFVLDSNSAVDGDGKRKTDSVYKDNLAGAVSGSATPGAYVDFTYYLKTEGNAAVNLYIKDVILSQVGATDIGYKAVRFAIIDGFKSETGTVATEISTTKNVWVSDPTQYVKNGYAIKSIQTDEAVAGTVTDDDLGPVNALTKGQSGLANKIFTVAAPTSAAPADANISVITIRVWLEGEDLNCTVEQAASMKFKLEVIFGDAGNS